MFEYCYINYQFASCLTAVSIKNENALIIIYIHLLTCVPENIKKRRIDNEGPHYLIFKVLPCGFQKGSQTPVHLWPE